MALVHVAAPGLGILKNAQDLTIDTDDSAWVIDFDPDNDTTPVVLHIDPQGQLLAQWPSNTNYGNSILLEPVGTLLIGGNDIDRFTADGGFVDAHGQDPESNDIPFYTGMAYDHRGFIWIADPIANEVKEFDFALNPVAQLGSRGSGPGMYDGPGDLHAGPNHIALDINGDLYVNDPHNSRMMKLSREGGSMLGSYDFAGSQEVGPIAIDPMTGRVYVGRTEGVDLICPL